MITGLDHVQVAAPPGCEAEARAFYGTLLGLVEHPKPPALAARGGVWFGWLHVGVAADFAPATKAHPALRVTGLEALAERLTAAGSRCAGTMRSPASRASTPTTRGATGWSSWPRPESSGLGPAESRTAVVA